MSRPNGVTDADLAEIRERMRQAASGQPRASQAAVDRLAAILAAVRLRRARRAALGKRAEP